MSEDVCKDCYMTHNRLVGHFCLNGEWIEGVVERNRTSEPVLEHPDCLIPGSTLGFYYDRDTKALVDSDVLHINRESYINNFFSNDLRGGNSHPTRSNQDLAQAGKSNHPMTMDSDQSHIRELSVKSVNDQDFNIDDIDTTAFNRTLRHSFSKSNVQLNIDELINTLTQTALEDNLWIPSISNSSNNTPEFPSVSGTMDHIITDGIPSLDEFRNAEPESSIINDNMKFINTKVDGNHVYEISGMKKKYPVISKNIIMRPNSQNEPEIKRTNAINQYTEVYRQFSTYDQKSEAISLKDDVDCMTATFPATEYEADSTLMLNNFSTHESSFYTGSINVKVTKNMEMLQHNCPNTSKQSKILLENTDFRPDPKECTMINTLLKQKSDSDEGGSSDDPPALLGSSFSQLNEPNNHECLHISQPVHKVERHSVVRTGLVKFTCNVCQKSFIKKGNFKKHMNICKSIKAYKCPDCGKSFTRSYTLRRHYLIHTGEKSFQCKICKKSFNRIEHLDRHNLIHSGEKRFKCEICEKTFTLRGDLVKHNLIHSGEKRFKCEICEKTFTRRETLVRHNLIHTSDKQFECEICRKKFSRKSNMKRHFETHKKCETA